MVLAVIESELCRLSGIRLSDEDTGNSDDLIACFRFDSLADDKTMAAVIRCIPDGGCLMFFDGAYPRVTDPGATVIYWRATDGLQVSWGNHGWMSSVIPINDGDAARYLQLCARWHQNEGNDSCRMWDGNVETRRPSLSGRHSVDPTLGARERLILSRRLAGELT
jgi:hypothetical protein